MQQLVGFAGQRYFLALKVTEVFSVATFGAIFLLIAPRYGDRSTAWIALAGILPAGGLITLAVGLHSWSLQGVSVRLGFGIPWWSAPLAVGLAAVGSAVTLMLLALPEGALPLAISSFAFGPAFLGWIGAVGLLGLFALKGVQNMTAAKAAAEHRRTALKEVASDFEKRQLERVTLTCNADTHLLPDNVLPSPKGRPLFLLASKPWYEAADFPWVLELERNFRDILAEALSVLNNRQDFGAYDYPGVNQGGWKSFSFVSQGKENVQNLARCPKTAAALQRVPRYPHFRDAMLSLLEPRRDIPPHQDYHNVHLTCHLGLRVPKDTGIRVAGIERPWKEGKCLVFDSSYTHTAWNHGDANRLVLLIDFLHPEINDAEFAWLQRIGLA